MIINGRELPCIGFIRAKPVAPDRWELSIYPPADTGPLDGTDGASHIEVMVDSASVERIARVAPHLMPGVAYRPQAWRQSLDEWGGYPKVEGPGPENRPGPSPLIAIENRIEFGGISK
jgi:hypothetical protein